MKRVFTYNDKEDFEAYSLFKEYALFSNINRDGSKYYYILKNRGNKCQQIYTATDKEIRKAKESYSWKPDIYNLVNDFLVDSDVVDDVLEELDIYLTANKYNL